MKLKKLRLRNFRRYADEVIEFEDGVIGIVGLNGTGKSTIIEGIGYAIYGSQPSLTRTGKDDVKRSNAPDGESWGVELWFEIQGYEFHLIRMTKGAFNKFKPDVRLLRNGTDFVKGDKDVRLEMFNLLQMDYRAFSSSVFCQQSEVDMLSSLQPAERKRMVLGMLKIGHVDEAIKVLRQDIRDYKQQVKALESVIGDTGGAIEKELEETEDKIKEGEKELNSVNSRKDEAEKKAKDVDSVQVELLNSRRELDKERRVMEEAHAKHERGRGIRELISGIEDDIEKEEELIIEEDNDAPKKLKELNKEKEELSSSLVRAQYAHDTAMERMSGIEELDAVCPTCEQKISEAHKEVVKESCRQERNKANEEISEITAGLTDIDAEIEKLKKKVDIISENEKYRMSVERNRKTLEQKKKELEALGADDFSPEAKSRIETELIRVDTQLSSNDKELHRVRKDISSINDELVSVQSNLSSLKSKQEMLGERLEKFNADKDKLNDVGEKVKLHNMTDKALADFRMHLIGKVRPMLAMFTSQLVREMTNGRYQKVDIDENYDIRMYDHGVPYPLKRFSGGEQAVVNLALRLALSRMIAVQRNTDGLGFIILDEVFGSADSQRREMIMETLSGLKSLYSQIICITHIDSVVEMFPNAVVVETDGPLSHVRTC